MNQENNNQKLCGVKLHLPLNKHQEEHIDHLARKHNYKFILMPYQQEEFFIVAFENQKDRDEFRKELDQDMPDELQTSSVESIKMGE